MKKIFIISILLVLYQICVAQNTVSFEYDDAGNRIKRETIETRSLKIKNSNLSETEKQKTSINSSFAEGEIIAFPNPVEDELSVFFKNIEINQSPIQLDVFSLSGQLLYTENIESTQTRIDTRNLSQGIYLVKVNSANNSQEFKIFKK